MFFTIELENLWIMNGLGGTVNGGFEEMLGITWLRAKWIDLLVSGSASQRVEYSCRIDEAILKDKETRWFKVHFGKLPCGCTWP
jgi:hypothetical protein